MKNFASGVNRVIEVSGRRFGLFRIAPWTLARVRRERFDEIVVPQMESYPEGHVNLYWLVAGPLVMGFFAAGPPWLALAARDLVRNRRLVWRDAGPWLLVLVASLALGFAIAGVMWLVD